MTNNKNLQIHLATNDEAGCWLHTHGMDVHGLPELEVRDCPTFLAEAAAEILRSVCDYMLESDKVVKAGENMRVSANTLFGFVKPEPLPNSEDHYDVERLQITEAKPICNACKESDRLQGES
jgi:hypothetical protein